MRQTAVHPDKEVTLGAETSCETATPHLGIEFPVDLPLAGRVAIGPKGSYQGAQAKPRCPA
jgi:hypothetical protein